MLSSAFHIRPFEPHDLAACQALFVAGQQENGNSKEYWQRALQHDFADITAHYIQPPRSTFLVAVAEHPPGPVATPGAPATVIGMVGVRPLHTADSAYYERSLRRWQTASPTASGDAHPHPQLTAELNRMVVQHNSRRMGVGRALVERCIDFCPPPWLRHHPSHHTLTHDACRGVLSDVWVLWWVMWTGCGGRDSWWVVEVMAV